ncbi:MAG: SUMF1/EgtB/PvdO family nonheme iron enzyme [Fibrobacteria bacterium]|nr:SUMF1/EgtB/PvdO family nonheme iron enzyme [Fibrobacteria bacterium]
MKKTVFGIAVLAVILSYAQQVSLSGKVVDGSAQAVSGAVVLLQKAGLSDTTVSDGKFSLSGSVTSISGSHHKNKASVPELRGDVLYLGESGVTDVNVDILGADGRLINRFHSGKNLRQSSIFLGSAVQMSGIYIVRIVAGGAVYSFKYVNTGITGTGSIQQSSGYTKMLAKLSAVDDTLVVTHPAAVTRKIPVTSYSGSLDDIVLEMMAVFTDARDGQIYKKVTIGEDIWMAENLNYKPAGGDSWCPGGNEKNCETYGRLYDYATVAEQHHGNGLDVCPSGWRLPATKEWDALITEAGGAAAGATRLKSVVFGDGSTDDFGFNWLPAGMQMPAGTYMFAGERGYLWMNKGDEGTVMGYSVQKGEAKVIPFDSNYYAFGFGVRCVQDTNAVYTTPETPPGMAYISGGTFKMGCVECTQTYAQEFEMPVHKVTLSTSFFIDTTEVTQKQYKDLMSATYSGFKLPDWDNGKGDEHPAYYVSWYDALLYCNARTKASGSTDTVYSYKSISGPLGNGSTLIGLNVDLEKVGYRLPTEAEFEYATRAGTTTEYYWGDDNIDDYAWHVDNTEGSNHPVAAKKPNAWGLYDMSGNMWEWCHDRFSVYSSGAKVDPVGPQNGSDKAVHGGARGSRVRSSFRKGKEPGRPGNKIGFRPVLLSP